MTSTHTDFMAHIYMHFNFADEETAQQARHKLEVWKQAFRLDKKLLYKFERNDEAGASEEPKEAKSHEEAKGKHKGEGKAQNKSTKAESGGGDTVQLLVRLGFSGHEKITEHRWVERIPTEEPFVAASPVTVKPDDAKFEETEKRFDELE
jgi:hypothetical protein